MSNSYFTGHGLGNEYIVLDPQELTFRLTPGRIARICDREKGIGSDGILTHEDSGSADFGLRIWNPDGSEAETSGNGLRVFACYLHATGRTRKNSFTVESPAGTVRIETRHGHRGAVDQVGTVRVETRQDRQSAEDEIGSVQGETQHDQRGAERVAMQQDHDGAAGTAGTVKGATVHMGKATFSPEALPCTLEVDELIQQPIIVVGETLTFTGVSVGNPHCVVFRARGQRRTETEPLRGDDLPTRRYDPLWSRDDLLRLGPALETHPIFPERTNVQLAEPTGPDSIRILIWERGAGETPSSGSSACAAASAAVRLGLVTSLVTVESPGGKLLVDVDEEFNLTLTGPVAEVARGTFSEAMLREILDAGD